LRFVDSESANKYLYKLTSILIPSLIIGNGMCGSARVNKEVMLRAFKIVKRKKGVCPIYLIRTL
jgi:hypothetical protein